MSQNYSASHQVTSCAGYEIIATGEDWLKIIRVNLDLTTGYLIDRTRVSDFYRQMKDHSPETGEFAFKLFDRRGHLRQEYKEHIIKKGSGTWGSELDSGLLLLFDGAAINHSARCHVGTMDMMRNILEGLTELFKKPVFVFVTSPMPTAPRPAPCTFHDNPHESFRNLGFRRVGNTQFFALSSDASHPCHCLSAAGDFDPAPPQPFKRTDYFIKIVADAIQSPDHVFRQQLDTKYSEMTTKRVSGVVVASGGDSVLHIVAGRGMAQSAACMLARWPELRNARNDAGETPLEALEWLIEEDKVRLEYFDELERHQNGWLSPPSNTEEILAVLRA